MSQCHVAFSDDGNVPYHSSNLQLLKRPPLPSGVMGGFSILEDASARYESPTVTVLLTYGCDGTGEEDKISMFSQGKQSY